MTYENDYTIPEEIMEQVCSEESDALSQVSKATAKLDEQLQAWRELPDA